MSARCPVCHMAVSSNQLPLVYRDMHFAFCSGHCRERFAETPHLYVGAPGRRAIKQAGGRILKRRRFRLDRAISGETGEAAAAGIGSMMGVKEVSVQGAEVRVTYDLLEATAEQIEARLGAEGCPLSRGWRERLVRALVHYKEGCETANMALPGSSHDHHH